MAVAQADFIPGRHLPAGTVRASLLAVLVQLPPFFPAHIRKTAVTWPGFWTPWPACPWPWSSATVSWATDRVFAGLQARRVALACVDVPGTERTCSRPMAVVT